MQSSGRLGRAEQFVCVPSLPFGAVQQADDPFLTDLLLTEGMVGAGWGLHAYGQAALIIGQCRRYGTTRIALSPAFGAYSFLLPF